MLKVNCWPNCDLQLSSVPETEITDSSCKWLLLHRAKAQRYYKKSKFKLGFKGLQCVRLVTFIRSSLKLKILWAKYGFQLQRACLELLSFFVCSYVLCLLLSALLSFIQFVPNTRTSHSLLASAQIGIVLSVPVHLKRSHQAAKVDVHEVGNVFEKAATEG